MDAKIAVPLLNHTYNFKIHVNKFLFQSISSRFLTTFWWIFCIVILFLYFINLKAYLFLDSTSLDSENEMTARLNSVGKESNAIQNKRLEAFLNDKNTRLGYVRDGAIEYTLQVSKDKNAFVMPFARFI